MTEVTGSTTSALLASIKVPDNVRDLDPEHVDALAKSIDLQGILVPLVVQASSTGPETYELVAGFHRYAAAMKLDMLEVPIVLRGEDDHALSPDADRATENILRKNLNPYEEAVAVKAMLDRGLSEDGAAQALGWSKQRITARVRLLGLPEPAQKLVGEGVIPLAAIDQLERIQNVEPKILTAITDAIASGDDWLGERLAREPGWVIDNALRDGEVGDVWVDYMRSVDKYDVERLNLGKRAGEHAEAVEAAHKIISPHVYGWSVEFEDAEIDQARAAGVLIEFPEARGGGIITDKKLYRELCKQALKRGAAEMPAKAEEIRKQREAGKKKDPETGQAADPMLEAKRVHRNAMNELRDQAHGINLELGASLINGLSKVDPNDIDVARFFVYALLGPDSGRNHWSNAGDRVAHLASQGIRVVIEEFRTDVTKTKKDGTRGRMQIDYGDRAVDQFPEDAMKWLWKFVDGAKTAGELYGRALVVMAAERYALSRIVLPASQRSHTAHYGAHKDLAEKMFVKLTKGFVPPSVRSLRKAIDKVDAELRNAEREQQQRYQAAWDAREKARRDALTDEERAQEDEINQGYSDEDLDADLDS